MLAGGSPVCWSTVPGSADADKIIQEEEEEEEEEHLHAMSMRRFLTARGVVLLGPEGGKNSSVNRRLCHTQGW